MKRFVLLGLFAAFPSFAHAQDLTIDAVEVLIGSGRYTAESVGWTLPVTLKPGEWVVLSQNAPKPTVDTSYNFDLSERAAELTAPSSPFWNTRPMVGFSVNGQTFYLVDDDLMMTGSGRDSGNESRDWQRLFLWRNLEVWVGYADNLHAGRCATYRCFPSPFFSATYFQSSPGYAPAGLEPRDELDKCPYGAAQCWDSAVIAFKNISPSTAPREH